VSQKSGVGDGNEKRKKKCASGWTGNEMLATKGNGQNKKGQKKLK
jgi:hypothetical protein